MINFVVNLAPSLKGDIQIQKAKLLWLNKYVSTKGPFAYASGVSVQNSNWVKARNKLFYIFKSTFYNALHCKSKCK